MSGSYDTAQICPNGHVINFFMGRKPEDGRKHCEKCGERTLVACPNPECNALIRGAWYSPNVLPLGGWDYDRPAYCHACGAAFPWTETAIQAAIQLSVEEGHLEGEEAEQFKQAIGSIVKETASTPLGISRVRRVMAKVGPAVADLVKDVLAEVVSESVKKAIWGDSAPQPPAKHRR